MANEYIHCPRCGSTDIGETDYETAEAEVDTDGRCCNKCTWEGSVQELVAEDTQP